MATQTRVLLQADLERSSESSKAEEVILPEIRFLTPAELDSLRANAEELKKKFEQDSWTKTR